jgi:hypothetical protein
MELVQVGFGCSSGKNGSSFICGGTLRNFYEKPTEAHFLLRLGFPCILSFRELFMVQ